MSKRTSHRNRVYCKTEKIEYEKVIVVDIVRVFGLVGLCFFGKSDFR